MDANIVVTQVSSAAVVVYALQRLKTARWFPWLQNEGQVWLKRGLSLAAAFGIHTGISYVWNAGTAPGVAHVLLINIPPASEIMIGLWHWANQFIMQELIYQGTANKVVMATPPLPAGASKPQETSPNAPGSGT